MTTQRVPVRLLRLFTDRPYTHTGTHLRGALLGQFPDRELLHNRRADGVARLPEVRYVVDDGIASVVAVGAGRDELLEPFRQVQRLPVPDGEYRVLGSEIHDEPVDIGTVDDLRVYESITPWLALNQANHARYAETASPRDRRAMLDRILVGNLLVAFRQIGVEIPRTERVHARVTAAEERPIRVRDNTFLALRVTFAANVAWTSWLGLGKQVAKGFGRFGSADAMPRDISA